MVRFINKATLMVYYQKWIGFVRLLKLVTHQPSSTMDLMKIKNNSSCLPTINCLIKLFMLNLWSMHNPYELVTITIHERLKFSEQHPYWQTLLMKAWPKEGEMAKTLGEPIGDGNPIWWRALAILGKCS